MVRQLIHECQFIEQCSCSFQGIWALSKIMDENKALNYPNDHHIDEMLYAHYSCPYYRSLLAERAEKRGRLDVFDD